MSFVLNFNGPSVLLDEAKVSGQISLTNIMLF